MTSNSKPEPKATATAQPPRPVARVRRQDLAAAAARRVEATAPLRPLLPGWLKLLLMALGVAAIVAFVVDMNRKFGGRAGPTKVSGAPARFGDGPGVRYVDPGNRFAAVVPEGWIVRHGEASGPEDAIFRGPAGVELRVRIIPLEYPSIGWVVAQARKFEEQFDIETQLKLTQFKGREAVERSTYLVQVHLLLLDVLDGHCDHHLEVSCPRDEFAKHESLMRALLNAYEPNTPAPAQADPPPPPAATGPAAVPAATSPEA